MTSIKYLRVLEGERLKSITCKITDAQIVLKEPKEIEISIWRNDEITVKKFEIQVQMPWGNLYTVARYETKEEAEEEYKKLVEQLKRGQAKVEIGKSISVALS